MLVLALGDLIVKFTHFITEIIYLFSIFCYVFVLTANSRASRLAQTSFEGNPSP